MDLPEHKYSTDDQSYTISEDISFSLSKDTDHHNDEVDEITLDFPMSIDINSNSADESSFFGAGTLREHIIENPVERNKKLCSIKGQSKLTQEEEKRVAEILKQEDDCIQNYVLPTEDERTRHTELDELLAGLGYVFEEEAIQSNEKVRGDPILRELAKERSLAEKEKLIDQALRSLLREPLPHEL